MANDPISLIGKKGDSVWVYSEKIKQTGLLGGHLF
jgi:hypothetical protein